MTSTDHDQSFHLANDHVNNGRFDEALAIFEKLMAGDADAFTRTKACVNLAIVHDRKGQIALALKVNYCIEKERHTPMADDLPVRCRIAACREVLNDGKEWSFYLINDSAFALDLAVLHEICYEWGDIGNSETTDVRATNLAIGAHALMWRDDGSGAELRMDFLLRVCARGRETKLRFEFPKLYRKTNLDQISGLGKPGYAVAVEEVLPCQSEINITI